MYVVLNFGGVVEIIIIVGFVVFVLKVLEEKFNMLFVEFGFIMGRFLVNN